MNTPLRAIKQLYLHRTDFLKRENIPLREQHYHECVERLHDAKHSENERVCQRLEKETDNTRHDLSNSLSNLGIYQMLDYCVSCAEYEPELSLSGKLSEIKNWCNQFLCQKDAFSVAETIWMTLQKEYGVAPNIPAFRFIINARIVLSLLKDE